MAVEVLAYAREGLLQGGGVYPYIGGLKVLIQFRKKDGSPLEGVLFAGPKEDVKKFLLGLAIQASRAVPFEEKEKKSVEADQPVQNTYADSKRNQTGPV